MYETIRQVSKKLPQQTTLIGFAGAPWTVATYMIEGGSRKEHKKTKTFAYELIKDFKVLIDLIIDATSAYLIRQADEGAEVVQIFDSWAGVLPPDQFDLWVIEPIQKIVSKVKGIHPELPIIGFPRGAGLGYEKFAERTGVDAVSLDSTIPLKWAAEKIQPYTVVQGNLDNQVLRTGGGQLDIEVMKILDAFSGGAHIFNLGHGVLPDTPVDHVYR